MEALGLTEAILWEAEYSSLNLTFNLHHRLIKLFSAPLRWRSPRLVANLMGITIALFSPILPSLFGPTFIPAAIAQTSSCNSVLLRTGSRGAAVRTLQENLRLGGYPNIGVDGVFGSQTDNVLRRFQGSSGLTADGVYGPATCQALTGKVARLNSTPATNPALAQSLNSLNTSSSSTIVASSNTSSSNTLATTRLLRNGDRGLEVTELQRSLQTLGYNVSADGVFGSQTEAAVEDFQRRRGIGVDGVVGPNTVREMNIALEEGNRVASKKNSSRYIVVVPSRSDQTLADVRKYIPEAQEFSSRRGTFVQAGQSDNRDAAESISYALRSYGLDARVFAP